MMFVVLQASRSAAPGEPHGPEVHLRDTRGKGVCFQRKATPLYTDVLTQTIKCEIIVILRRVSLPFNAGQSEVLKAVFVKSL